MTTAKKTLFNRFLDGVEASGNKLPDPIIIFMALCGVILVASWIAAMAGWSAVHPASGETITAVNLLNGDNFVKMITTAVKNFGGFPPLGLVLAVMIGIGVAEKSGWFEAIMRFVVEKAPNAIIVPVIILISILGNAAGDAGPIVLPPLAAMVFIRLGYHPVAGLVCAYASCLGAFAANLMLGMADVVVYAFTEPAAIAVDPNVNMNVAMNYYFIAVSTILLLMTSYFVTMKYTIPRLGQYTPINSADGEQDDSDKPLTVLERKALLFANISLLILISILLFLTLPEGALLRNAETGSLTEKSPLMAGLVIIITVLFLIPGAVYARVVGTANNMSDIAKMMSEGMATMASFIVIVFFAAQMLAYFSWSNLGQIIAITGAEALSGQSGFVLIIGFIFLTMLLNLLVGSMTAKWAILAPIFVPMFMYLGYHPAFTQMLYRIGDSISNPITPMIPYLPILLFYAQRYVKNMGMGTLIAALMPYSIAFLISWTIFALIWSGIGLPLGPDGFIHYTAPAITTPTGG